MVKSLLINFDDAEYDKLKKAKDESKLTWKKFFLKLISEVK